MKKLLLLILIGFLASCESSALSQEVNPVVKEVVISRLPFGESFYDRFTVSPEIAADPNEVQWQSATRLVIIYNENLYNEFPPSYFGVDINLEPGTAFNQESSNQFISLIYPTSLQSLISLHRYAKDELLSQPGRLIVEDFYQKEGTVIILDNESRQHLALFNDFPDPKKQITVNNHSLIARFATIVFIYHDIPQDALLEMNPPELPRENYILEFVNHRSQRVIMANMNDIFMSQSIVNFIDSWDETFLSEQLIMPYDSLLDNEEFLSLRLPPNACRISSSVQNNVLAGFPLPPLRMTTMGNVRAKVVYLDFLDYRLNESGQKLEERFLKLGNDVNKYFDAVSYGQMRMEWDIHPEPLLMPKNVSEYQLTRAADRQGFWPTLEIVYEMLELHRDSIDFSNTEVIVVMFNPNIPEYLADVSPAHPVDKNRPFVTNQGDLYNAVTIASDWPNHKWQVIVHELAHTIGLIDLYDYGVTENWNDHHRHVGGFDIMGAYQDNLEFLGWSRYLMKWVKDDQVFCTQPNKSKTLIPMQTIGTEVSDSKDLQMIVIPLDRYKVLVIEAKEKNQFCLTCDGLLVYTVDTTIDNGRGAIKVIPIDRSTHIFKNDAMIRVGESLETHSIRISLISASPNGYIVEINRVN